MPVIQLVLYLLTFAFFPFALTMKHLCVFFFHIFANESFKQISRNRIAGVIHKCIYNIARFLSNSLHTILHSSQQYKRVCFPESCQQSCQNIWYSASFTPQQNGYYVLLLLGFLCSLSRGSCFLCWRRCARDSALSLWGQCSSPLPETPALNLMYPSPLPSNSSHTPGLSMGFTSLREVFLNS